MALTARYLADKSALGRFPHPKVAARLRPLLEEGLVATCAIVDLEVLYSASGLDDYEAVLEEWDVLGDVPITPDVLREAIAVQHQLARGQAQGADSGPDQRGDGADLGSRRAPLRRRLRADLEGDRASPRVGR